MLKRILLVALLTIASAAVATAQTAAVKDYYNEENKVGFKYPASWATGATKWKAGTKAVQTEPGGAAFTVLMDLYNDELPNTGVEQAEVALSVATMDEAACNAIKPDLASAGDKPTVKTVGARTFYYIQGSDAGMGRAGTNDYYHTFQDGKCYELDFMKYGGIGRKASANEKALDKQFNAILHSLYFGK